MVRLLNAAAAACHQPGDRFQNKMKQPAKSCRNQNATGRAAAAIWPDTATGGSVSLCIKTPLPLPPADCQHHPSHHPSGIKTTSSSSSSSS
jgi:hypothetical protein